MKQIKTFLPILALAFVIGCASQSRVVYNTLSSIKVATDNSVSAYFDLVAQKKASIKGVPAVAKAYDTFEVVFKTAVSAAQFNTNTIASPDVSQAAAVVETTIAQSKTIQ